MPDKISPHQFSAVAMLAVANLGVCTFNGLYATQPVLPLFETVFAASKTEVALTISASTAAVALFAPWVGGVVDRFSRKRFMVTASLVLTLCTLMAATASSLEALYLWRFLQGAAIAGVYVPAVAYITEEAGSGNVGQAIAAFVTGNVLGGFSGRMLSAWVAQAMGWRAMFVALAAMNLTGALVTARFLPPSHHFIARGAAPALSWAARRHALLRPALLATFAIGFSVLFSQVAMFTYAVFYLSAPPFSLTPAALGTVFGVYLVGAAVTTFIGRFIDRIGSRLVLAAALMAGAAGACMTLLPYTAAVVLGLGVCCACTFVCQSAATSYLRIAAPAPVRALASGLYTMAYYAGGSAGGFFPGLLWTRTGWLGCVSLIVGVQFFAMTTALIWCRE